MEALSGSPLTLVVKAPNQEIGDQTVECFLDWTVRKLKKHLSAVYPTNPNERSQRIIYSGKLLHDNVLLKDVLSVTDAEEKCTVHLVCAPSPEEQAKRDASCSQSKEQNNTVRPSRSPVLTSNDGLRQRVTQSQQQTPQPPQQQQQNTFAYATSLPSTPGSAPVPPQAGTVPTSSMSAEQLQWMQHMYAQQMASYMQYVSMMAASSGGMQPAWNQAYQMSSSPWIQHSAPHPATSINQPHPAPQPAPHANAPQAQAPAAAPQANNAAAPPPQRMNVGGGQAVDDDNEDGVRRDWLDWTFTLCRFGILLSIVYFYSSIHRFLMVAGAVFVMYLYQAGFFQLRRRQRARPPVTPPQEQPPREGDVPQEEGMESNDTQPDESDSSTSSGDDADRSAETEPAEPPRPGVLATAWIFVSTFFTSIIPQGPPQQFPAN